MASRIIFEDEEAVVNIAFDIDNVVGVVLKQSSRATMMKNGTHTWQLYHHSTISI